MTWEFLKYDGVNSHHNKRRISKVFWSIENFLEKVDSKWIPHTYVLRTSIDLMKDNGFELAKERSRRYPAQSIADEDYADDIALLANTSAQAENLQHSLERAAAGIGLHANADKENMCFKQRGDISTLKSEPLKLVDKITYLGSSISSTEKDINSQLAKAWIAIDRLSVIWKSDLGEKIKRSFFSKQRPCRYCYMDALHWL